MTKPNGPGSLETLHMLRPKERVSDWACRIQRCSPLGHPYPPNSKFRGRKGYMDEAKKVSGAD